MRKISISQIAWKPEHDRNAYRVMQKVGISCIETTPARFWSDPDRADKEETAERIEELKRYDITPLAMQALLFGRRDLVIFGDPEARLATLNYLKHLIIATATAGFSVLVFGSPRNKLKGALPHEEAMKIATEFFQKVAEFAKGRKIDFCIEPTPSIYGADFIETTIEAVNLVKRCDFENLKINLDLGTLRSEADTLEKSLEFFLEYAGHFHVSEFKLVPIGLDFDLHNRVSEVLKRNDYERAVSIEMLPLNDFDPEYMEKVMTMVKNVYTK